MSLPIAEPANVRRSAGAPCGLLSDASMDAELARRRSETDRGRTDCRLAAWAGGSPSAVDDERRAAARRRGACGQEDIMATTTRRQRVPVPRDREDDYSAGAVRARQEFARERTG